jgi:hypothetical protein
MHSDSKYTIDIFVHIFILLRTRIPKPIGVILFLIYFHLLSFLRSSRAVTLTIFKCRISVCHVEKSLPVECE